MGSMEVSTIIEKDEGGWEKLSEDLKSEEVQLSPFLHKPKSKGSSGFLAILAVAINVAMYLIVFHTMV